MQRSNRLPQAPCATRSLWSVRTSSTVLVLSIFSLFVLAADTLLSLNAPAHEVLSFTDTALCVLFFADYFVRNFVRAPRRTRYFLRAGWLDLISSVPAIDVLRLGRISRVARILRLLPGQIDLSVRSEDSSSRATESRRASSPDGGHYNAHCVRKPGHTAVRATSGFQHQDWRRCVVVGVPA